MKGCFNAWLVKKMQPTKIFLVALNHSFSNNNIQIKNHPLQPWARQVMWCSRENSGDGNEKKQRRGKKRNKKYWGFVISSWIALCAKMIICLMLMHANVLHKWIFTFRHETDFESFESFSKLRWKEETCIHQQNKNVWAFFFLNLSKAVMERSTLWFCRGENTLVFFV